MTAIHHLETLRKKHAELDAALDKQYARPVPDTDTIKNLKIKKLRIKDEINKLQEHQTFP